MPRGDDGGGDESERRSSSSALAAPPLFSASVGTSTAALESARGRRSIDPLALPPASDGACTAGITVRLGENPNQFETVLSKDTAVAPSDGLELEAPLTCMWATLDGGEDMSPLILSAVGSNL